MPLTLCLCPDEVGHDGARPSKGLITLETAVRADPVEKSPDLRFVLTLPYPSTMSDRHPANAQPSQFKTLRASSLYCQKCRQAMPVRERLLLVLPQKEIYDYLCTGCASSVGQREVSAAEKLMSAVPPRRAPAPRPASPLLLP